MRENAHHFLIFPFFETFRGAFFPSAPPGRRPCSGPNFNCEGFFWFLFFVLFCFVFHFTIMHPVSWHSCMYEVGLFTLLSAVMQSFVQQESSILFLCGGTNGDIWTFYFTGGNIACTTLLLTALWNWTLFFRLSSANNVLPFLHNSNAKTTLFVVSDTSLLLKHCGIGHLKAFTTP